MNPIFYPAENQCFERQRRMIETIYPEHIQAQLDLLDEMIAKIYEEELPQDNRAILMNITEMEHKKKLLYERIRPLLDAKVRLIENSCPKYIVHENK